MLDFWQKKHGNTINLFSENVMYEKTIPLLASMAMRSSHDFGIKEPEEREQDLRDMSHLYDLYQSGLTDEVIAQEIKWDTRSVAQVREEVDGTGFFRPTS